MQKISCILFFVFIGLFGMNKYYSNAAYVKFYPCSYNPMQRCTINHVFVYPCPEAVYNKPCKLHRGSVSSVIYEYTPGFSGNLYATVHAKRSVINWPVYENVYACGHTSCPARQFQKQSFFYSSSIKNSFRKGLYTVESKLRNEYGEECCFKVKVEVV